MMYALMISISLTSLILISGLVVMAIGGKLNERLSSKLMSFRVFAQAIAILILAIAYFFK